MGSKSLTEFEARLCLAVTRARVARPQTTAANARLRATLSLSSHACNVSGDYVAQRWARAVAGTDRAIVHATVDRRAAGLYRHLELFAGLITVLGASAYVDASWKHGPQSNSAWSQRPGLRTHCYLSADAMPVCPKSSPFDNSGSRVSRASAYERQSPKFSPARWPLPLPKSA
jgi:hypothetical protein